MKKVLKFMLVCLLCLSGISLIYILFVILYPWAMEFKPDQRMQIPVDVQAAAPLPGDTVYRVLTWNIGYAGLGQEMDFFYEGGKRVRPTKEENLRYLEGISRFLSGCESVDFMLLQEIDFNSARSYRVNQFDLLQESLSYYQAVRASNYRSAFVPVPLAHPMGKVDAGQATFSLHPPMQAERIATPGSYSWPTRLFMLKRCFLVSAYPLANGRSLLIYNIHNSAFDDATNLREQELVLLKELISADYQRGDYVVVGGDWNQNPAGWRLPLHPAYKLTTRWPIEPGYMPAGWTWAYDPKLPTNRDVHEPFQESSTTCTLLDFFLVSPNIRVEQVETLDLHFEHSDHQPVILTFRLE